MMTMSQRFIPFHFISYRTRDLGDSSESIERRDASVSIERSNHGLGTLFILGTARDSLCEMRTRVLDT